MPPVVAGVVHVLIGLGIGNAVAGAIAPYIVSIGVSLGASYAIGGIAKALAKKPTDNSNALARNLTIRQAAAPRRVIYGQGNYGGIITFANTRGPQNLIVDLVITLTGHEVESVDEMFFDGEEIPVDGNGDGLGKWAGHCHVEKNLGTDAQAAFAGLMANSPEVWTANHRQRGCAGVYVWLDVSDDQLTPGGAIPNITFNIKGKKCYDPRWTATGWTENAAQIVADYLCNTRFGMGADYATEIDEDALIAAANISDESIDLTTSSPATTEHRYHINGAFDFEAEPGGVLEDMMGAMAGWLVPVSGKWMIFPGAFRLATLELTDDDFIQPLQVQTRRSARDLFNGVKGTFVSVNHANQQTDFPVVTVPDYVAEDGGVSRWKDINLPFTRTDTTCQRLASIDLERIRRQITVETVCKMRAYELTPGDIVEVTHARFGWDHKDFEVAESRLTQVEDAEGNPAFGVALTLRESDLDVYGFLVDDYGNMIDPGLLDLEARKTPFSWSPSMMSYPPSTAAVLHPITDYSFGIAQRYLTGADGTSIAQIQISGFIPISVFSTTVPRPRTRDLLGATASTGGKITGGRTYYMAVCGLDAIAGGAATGRFTSLSEIVRVEVPALSPASDENTITIENLKWPATNAGWVLFAGLDPHRLSWQSQYFGSVPSEVSVTGPNARPDSITLKGFTTENIWPNGLYEHFLGAPDQRFHHLKVAISELVHGGIWGGEVVSTGSLSPAQWTIELAVSPPFTTNALAGRYISMIAAPITEEQWNTAGVKLAEFLIESNDGTTVTLAPGQSDPSLQGVVAGSVMVVRTKATAVGSDTDGNYIEDSGFGQGGQTLGDASPDFGGGDGTLTGMILRIIGGAGAGYQYWIKDNLVDGSPPPTPRIYIHGDWFETPDTTSVFIVIGGHRIQEFETAKFAAETFNQTARFRIAVPNLSRKQLIVTAISVSESGREAPEATSPSREIWIYGGPSGRKVGITIDAGASAITTGVKGSVQVDFAGDIIGWSILETSGNPGSIEIEVDKSAGTQATPTLPNTTTDKISASAPIVLVSSDAAGTDEIGVATWATGIAQWDTIQFNVTSATDVRRVTLWLRIRERN